MFQEAPVSLTPDLGMNVVKCPTVIPCHTVNLGTPICTLTCGWPHEDRPSYVDITSFSNLDGATTIEYAISFDGIVNPRDIGADDQLVYFRMMVMDATDNVLASQSNYYAYSILDNGTPVTAHGGTTAPDFVGSSYSTAATLVIAIPTAPTQDATSKYIFIFPFNLSPGNTLASLAPAVTGEIHPETKWGVISTPGALTSVTVTFAGSGIGALYIGAKIKVLIITGEKLVGEIELQPATSTAGTFFASAEELTALPVYPSTAGKMYKSNFGDIMLHYKLEKPIPADGCIKFKFATAIPDNFCTVSQSASASLKNSWKCSVSSGDVSLTGLGALSAADHILVITRASVSATNIGGIAVQTFADAGCIQKIETDAGGATTTPPILEESADPAPLNTYFKAPIPITRLAIKGKKADFAFNFTPITNLVAASFHHLTFSASFALAVAAAGRAYPSCSIFDGLTKIAAPCAFAGSNLSIYPSQNMNAGTTYRIEITTQGEDLGANGFLQPATNIFQDITLTTYLSNTDTTPGDTGVIHFATPDTELTSLKVTPAHISQGYMNIFKFEMTASVALLASDALVFEFPLKTDDGAFDLFAEDLGLGIPTGTTIDLKLTALTGSPICFLKKGSSLLRVPPRIKCTGGAAASAANLVVEIPAVNPTHATETDKLILHFRVYIEDSNRKVKAERWVMNAAGLDATAPATAEPSVDWNGGAPIFGTSSKTLDITFTPTPAQIILVGSGIVLTSTTTSVNHKYAGVNVLHLNSGLGTSPVNIGDFTAPLTAVSQSVTALLLADVSGRTLVTNTKTSTLTAAVADTGLTATVSSIANPNDGNWYLQTLAFTTTANIPGGAYLVYEIVGAGGTFEDLDPSFLVFKDNFPSTGSIKWKYVEVSATEKKFQVWNLPILAHTVSHELQINAKWVTATTSKFTVNVYTNSGLTDLWGTKQSAAITVTPLIPIIDSVSLTALPALKVNTNIDSFTLQFKLVTAITAATGAGAYLDLNSPALNCAGTAANLASVTLKVGGGSTDPLTVTSYTGKIAYGEFFS